MRAANNLLPVSFNDNLLSAFAALRKSLNTDMRPDRCSNSEDVLQNRFFLAGEEYRFEQAILWDRKDVKVENPLAGFELQYQDYLPLLADSLAARKDKRYANKWEEIISSWIAANPLSPRELRYSWSPYVISERLRNWLVSLHWLQNVLSVRIVHDLEESFALQTAFLAHNPEYDLQGNHLLQNFCGLAVCAAFLKGKKSPELRRRVLKKLAVIAEDQVLADGMHEEKSCAYHVKTFQDILEVIILAEAGGYSDVEKGDVFIEKLKYLAARMRAHLALTLAPAGDIPMFNDTKELDVKQVKKLVEVSEKYVFNEPILPGERIEGSGYLMGKTGDWAAVFDGGSGGPDHQLGHAHADHLGFELWLKDQKTISDSGNSTYIAGDERNWFRSTAAHNTVRIDRYDSMELWSAFRVGRRPSKHKVNIESSSHSLAVWRGSHDGYSFLPGSPIHERTFTLSNYGVCIWDELTGTGIHLIESFLHLHPGIELIPGDNMNVIDYKNKVKKITAGLEIEELIPDCICSLKRWKTQGPEKNSKQGWIAGFWPKRANCSLTCGSGYYAPSFSKKIPRTMLRLSCETALPLKLCWVLSC